MVGWPVPRQPTVRRYNADQIARLYSRVEDIAVKREPLIAIPLAVSLLILSGCPLPNWPTPAGNPLPTSLKGYELYTWVDGSRTWFTLLPGTNRLKTPDEVFAGDRTVIDAAGWFAITVVGLDAVGEQLARLPDGAPVFVSTVLYPPGATLEVLATPESVMRRLRQDATELGLDLQFMQ